MVIVDVQNLQIKPTVFICFSSRFETWPILGVKPTNTRKKGGMGIIGRQEYRKALDTRGGEWSGNEALGRALIRTTRHDTHAQARRSTVKMRSIRPIGPGGQMSESADLPWV